MNRIHSTGIHSSAKSDPSVNVYGYNDAVAAVDSTRIGNLTQDGIIR